MLWKDTDVDGGEGKDMFKFNIVDTPGHADFGAEVERIDSVALVVDATEGTMTQTKFVLGKALARNLRPFVVINKADRSTHRIGIVENEIFDLFASLDATDEQMEYPVVYASAKDDWCVHDMDDEITVEARAKQGMKPLFQTLHSKVPAPSVEHDGPFSSRYSVGGGGGGGGGLLMCCE